MYEPELHLGAHVLVPDLAAWRAERFIRPAEAYFSVAPDWVCEVLSPSTRLIDRRVKMRVYAEHGVGHVWLVDPLVRSLEVFELDGPNYRALATYGEDEVVRAVPFDAIALELIALWPTTVTPLPK